MGFELSACEKFILLCLRSRWDQNAFEQKDQYLADKNFSWENFLQVVQNERLGPLLSYLLSPIKCIPDQIRKNLNKHYLSAATQNALFFNELEKTLLILSQNNLKVIILKGAALATQIYPTMALRPMVDLDILVMPEDVSRVIALLKDIGYRNIRQEEMNGFVMDFENEMTLCKQDKIPVPFEVHWSLFNSAYYQKTLPSDWIWGSSSPIKFNRAFAFMLNPSIHYLYLCGHLSFHHAGKGLLWKHDLAEIIMQYSSELNWDKVIDYAHMYDLVLPLKINTLSLTETYGPILPPEIISKLEEATPTNTENQNFKRLSSELKTPGRTFIYDFTEIPNQRKKLLFVVANIFPSINYMKNRYKIRFPIFLPYYYIYRWYLGFISLIRKTDDVQ